MIGRTLSHYRVLESLGSGGMGVVYKAEDTRLGRLVAIKMLPDEIARDRTALERFQREARTASALNHPNICTIYEVDEDDGKPFLVMELLEGQTLHGCGRLDQERILDLAIEFADALATAHAARIVHRDLKPANLFLTKLGHLKILDFGLATIARADDSKTAVRGLTETGTTVGTVAYMSPEQARGLPVDGRTDLFSFGAVLYELATGRRAFAGTNTATIFDSILHHDPPPVEGPLGPVIAKALEKDRELRYQSAADLRADLKRLKHESGSTAARRPAPLPKWLAVAAVAAVLAIVGVWYFRPLRSAAPKRVTVAVLPFSDLGGSHDRDFLSLALPDELITILSHSRDLAVRPFAMTKKYTGDIDPQKVGRDLKVDHVITGDFRDSGSSVGISVESIDVEKNDVLWRDSVEVPAGDLIAMRNALSERLRAGLLPSLHVDSQKDADRPANDAAYTLFLKASAVSTDPLPNKEALAMLQRAVALDPSYAPVWEALSSRYYMDAEYADGGDKGFAASEAAARRALSLDPDLLASARRLIVLRTENGDLASAYRDAKEFLSRRPDSAEAHFTMSYVLRYAGLSAESARECETARALDPHNLSWRSCSIAFLNLGQAERAREFAALDAGSGWADVMNVYILLRSGDRAGALARAERASKLGSIEWLPLLRASVQNAPQAVRARSAEEAYSECSRFRDGETQYQAAIVFGSCNDPRHAIELLRDAIARGYCGVPAMDSDPAFAAARKLPAFRQVRDSGEACQQRFLAAMRP